MTLTATTYDTYFDGAQFVHFLLGPATVALAVPLYAAISARAQAMCCRCSSRCWPARVTAIASAIALAGLLGGSRETLLSLAPKSVTTPIAMGIAEQIGGMPVADRSAGGHHRHLGAVMARGVFNALRVSDPAMRGFAVGVAAHGIGTARAFQVTRRPARSRPGDGPERRGDCADGAAGSGLDAVSGEPATPGYLPMAERRRLAKNRFMFIRPPPRQPKQTWLWLAPYAAIGIFALAMLIVTGLLQWREQDTALSALEGDMHWAEQYVMPLVAPLRSVTYCSSRG